MFILCKDPRKNLFLAPLQNITTAPYRKFLRTFYDIHLVSVPMLYMKQIEANPKTVLEDLHDIESERPISIQLIGNDVDALRTSIDYLESYKYDVLDINAGCPSRRALKSHCGGYLIRDLELLKKLLEAAIKKASRPISLKTRIGFKNSENIREFASLVNDIGISFIIIHARTVLDKYDVRFLNLNAIKEFKNNLSIPLIGNGDIIDPISAKHFLEQTNVDGLMIGRATMGNPEIFSQIHDFLVNDKYKPFFNDKIKMKRYLEKYEVILDNYLNDINLTYHNNDFKLTELKRNAIWLTRDIENATHIRSKLSRTKNLDELKLILKEYF